MTNGPEKWRYLEEVKTRTLTGLKMELEFLMGMQHMVKITQQLIVPDLDFKIDELTKEINNRA